MTHDPLISVLIPAYNREDVLERAISSAQSQTYPNVEIIVLNDGSTDNTSEVISRHVRDSDIIALTHDMNKGQQVARNTLKAAANGAAHFWLDSDDEFYSDSTLQMMFNALTEYGVDWVAAPTMEHRTQMIKNPELPFNQVFDDLLRPNADIARLVSADISASCDFLEGAPGWWEWCTRALRQRRWVLVDQPGLVVHTEYEDRLSNQYQKNSPTEIAQVWAPIVDSRPEFFVESVLEWNRTNRIPHLVDLYDSLGDYTRAEILKGVGSKAGLYPAKPDPKSVQQRLGEMTVAGKRAIVKVLRRMGLKQPAPLEEQRENA